MNRKLIDIIYLGVSFCLINISYMTCMNNLITIFQEEGVYFLSSFQVGFFLSGFISIPIIRLMTPKWSLFASSILFVIYPLVLTTMVLWLTILISFMFGVSNGLLWSSQVVLLTSKITSLKELDEKIKYTNIFFQISESSFIIGNIIAILMLYNNIKIIYTIWTSAIIAFVGCLCIIRVNSPKESEPYKINMKEAYKNVIALSTKNNKIYYILSLVFFIQFVKTIFYTLTIPHYIDKAAVDDKIALTSIMVLISSTVGFISSFFIKVLKFKSCYYPAIMFFNSMFQIIPFIFVDYNFVYVDNIFVSFGCFCGGLVYPLYNIYITYKIAEIMPEESDRIVFSSFLIFISGISNIIGIIIYSSFHRIVGIIFTILLIQINWMWSTIYTGINI